MYCVGKNLKFHKCKIRKRMTHFSHFKFKTPFMEFRFRKHACFSAASYETSTATQELFACNQAIRYMRHDIPRDTRNPVS